MLQKPSITPAKSSLFYFKVNAVFARYMFNSSYSQYAFFLEGLPKKGKAKFPLIFTHDLFKFLLVQEKKTLLCTRYHVLNLNPILLLSFLILQACFFKTLLKTIYWNCNMNQIMHLQTYLINSLFKICRKFA